MVINARLLFMDGPLDRRFEVSSALRLRQEAPVVVAAWHTARGRASVSAGIVTLVSAARRSTLDCHDRRIGKTAGKVVAQETTASV